MFSRYKYILSYLSSHKLVSFSIFALAILSTLFYSVGIGLFVPLLETMQVGSSDAATSWLLQKIDTIFAFLHITPTFTILLFGMVLMVALKVGITFLHVCLSMKISIDLNKELRVQGVSRLIDVGVEYYHKKKVGDLINIIVKESLEAAQAVYYFLLVGVQVFTLAMYGILMSLLSWQLTILSFIIFILVSLSVQFRIKLGYTLAQATIENRNQLSSKLLEIFLGIKIVKAYQQEKLEKERVSAIAETARSLEFTRRLNGLALTSFSEFIMVICLAVITFCGIKIFHVNTSVLITFLFILSRLAPDVTKLNEYRNSLETYVAPLNKTIELMTKDDKPHISSGRKTLEGVRESIKFDHINFQYGPSEKFALRDVTFSIPKNHIVALVGASGSGKSTIIELLLRFYDPQDGKILIDGMNLKDIDLHSWRSKVGVALQEHYLFHDTIYNNILYGNPNASKEEIFEAARKACIHEDIMKFPEGYETIAGDRGIRFSGGQKQRIALARALVRKPEILVLDEAMSALDSQAEAAIKDAIEAIKGECTILIVAHRFFTIEKADTIVVLENGRIAEIGTHRQLLENKEHYSKYYDFQHGRASEDNKE